MGRPKAWLSFHGELMLPRVVRILSEVVSPIVVVAARGRTCRHCRMLFKSSATSRKEQGPLQGLAAGLGALRGHAEAAYLPPAMYLCCKPPSSAD